MSKPDVSGLTEEQILDALAAKRRAQRLQSLQRVAQNAREGAAVVDMGPSSASALALPAPSGTPIAIPLPTPHTKQPGDAAAIDVQSGGNGSQVPLLLRKPSGMPVLRTSPLGSGRAARARSVGEAVRRMPWTAWRDRGLLLVELGAIAALMLIVVGQFSGLGNIDAETPDPSRAPAVAAAAVAEEELPGSSTPPASSDLPAPLRPLVRAGTPIPIPTPGPQAATRIVIPAIQVDSVIVEGDTWELLKQGVGHHVGTPHPGEIGNAVYSGHNDVYGEVFRRLEELKPGDLIKLYAGATAFQYEVKRTRIVGPKETSVMSATRDATLTLITCHPYRIDTHRLVIIATLAD